MTVVLAIVIEPDLPFAASGFAAIFNTTVPLLVLHEHELTVIQAVA